MNGCVAVAEEILAAAIVRGQRKSLPYAGEVTPREAHSLFSTFGAKIVDVRSRFEFEYIGRIPGSSLIEWKQWPSGELNPQFLTELRQQHSPNTLLLFLCRSGVRSHFAATVSAQAGYQQAFNILEGFEGDLNAQQRRGQEGGWRLANLPWIQS